MPYFYGFKTTALRVALLMEQDQETPLEMALRHVHTGEQLVADQIALIKRLRRDGHVTRDAESFLEALQHSLAVMREHLASEKRKVEPQ